MSFRPYFLQGGTALERGLQTAAEALGQGIINRAEQTTYQNALEQLGIPFNTAQALTRLATSSQGGMTEATRLVSDYIARQGGLTPRTQAGMAQSVPQQGVETIKDKVNVDENGNVIDVTQDALVSFQKDPTYDPFEGLKPAERVKRQEIFYKDNSGIQLSNSEKIKSLKKKAGDLRQMDQLNESGNLPSGVGQLFNVNPDGTLKFTQLATPEAQLYAKLVADQIKGAKDTFGGRVTNFEVDSFVKTFPTLSNSRDGRSLINKVVTIKNEIEKLDADALEAVYKTYGSRGIDPTDARRFAEDFKKPQEDALYQRLENLVPEFEKQQELIKIREKIPKGRILVQLTDQSGNKAFYQPLEKDFEELKADYESKGQILERL